MPFNVQEMSFSYTNFQQQKISLPWEGETPLPPPTPSPLSVTSLPCFGPRWQILAAPLLLE